MFKVSIKKEEVETNGAYFETEADCSAWVLENHEAFPEGYICETTNVTEEQALKKEKIAALKYLSETDWYVIRFMETQVAIPSEISTLRAAARLKVIN